LRDVDEPVAVKVIDLKKEDELSRQFMNEEINILEIIKTRSPVNLLKLFDVFKTKNNLYIITEFCEGKDVAKLLRKKKRLSEVEAQSILRQLMNAYREIYELSIVHRDLKLANIFIRKGIIKLADFGFAINSEKCQEKFDYNVGSPYYMPP
jgi:serine/threonine protein kinase